MWHTLEQVANSRRLDRDAFADFALKNREKYGLDDKSMVGTWHVDGLIRDFKLTVRPEGAKNG